MKSNQIANEFCEDGYAFAKPHQKYVIPSKKEGKQFIQLHPVLRYDVSSIQLTYEDRVCLYGHSWVCVKEGVLLCEDSLGNYSYREDRDATDSLDYESSDIKLVIDKWAKEAGVVFYQPLRDMCSQKRKGG